MVSWLNLVKLCLKSSLHIHSLDDEEQWSRKEYGCPFSRKSSRRKGRNSNVILMLWDSWTYDEEIFFLLLSSLPYLVRVSNGLVERSPFIKIANKSLNETTWSQLYWEKKRVALCLSISFPLAPKKMSVWWCTHIRTYISFREHFLRRH